MYCMLFFKVIGNILYVVFCVSKKLGTVADPKPQLYNCFNGE